MAPLLRPGGVEQKMVAAGQLAGAGPVVQTLAVGDLNQPVSRILAGKAAVGGCQARVAGQWKRCYRQCLPVTDCAIDDDGAVAEVAV